MRRAHRMVLRLMLLVALALGVVAMHSLGHLSEPGMSLSTHHSAMQATGLSHTGQPPADHHPTMAGWVCLAIIGMGVLLLWLESSRRRISGAPSRTGRWLRLWSQVPRGPPPTRTVVLRI
ncbi:hypothetical protein ACIBO2_04300 [Nonomuraea sp. NPDC050022]|uniref:hypothetical protein n=1 Tax=unclassified Nonomuraea TaxID=2593643 RepID=UPI00340B1551